MLRKKISFLYLFISALLGSAITFVAFKAEQPKQIAAADSSAQTATAPCNYNLTHLNGYKYIQPLISAEPDCESEKYASLKGGISNFIDNEQKSGLLTSASVYVRDFTRGEWMAISPDEKYDPGSLLKVGVLITFLRMAEANPNLLNTELVYHGDKSFTFPIEHFRSDTVVEGRKYKVKELLRYMITYSDNRATWFLEKNMCSDIFKKVFTDLGMKEPTFTDQHYLLTVREYSTMMKALYYAGYLNIQASEYATALLTESVFKEGLVKELPPSIKVAHKFGESGDQNNHQLHESGIIYIGNNPYLITVMTQGTDWDELSKVMSHISRMVYDHMSSNPS